MNFLTKSISCFLAFAIITVDRSPGQVSTTPTADEAMSRAAILGYAANVQAFPYYQCRYTHTKAQAKSVEDALRGRFINALTYENRLLVDGDKDLYEGLAPAVPPNFKQAEPLSGKKGFFKVPAFVSSDRYLGDGKRVMNYCPQLGSLGLWSNEKGTRRIEFTPLGMFFVGHRSHHGPDVLMSQTDSLQMSSDGMQEIDGRPVVTVRFKDRKVIHVPEGPLTTTCVYSFDLGKGHLPIRMTLLWNGKPKSRVFVTDVRECSNQRWFPERSVVVDTPDKAGALFDVSEIKLLELDADHHPAAGDFAFTIPAGTSVSDQHGGRGLFKLKQEEKIGIEDLPMLFTMLERVQVTPLMDTAVPHASPYRWVWAAAGLAVAFGGVGFFLHRRLRARQVTA